MSDGSGSAILLDTALNLFRRGFCTLELFYYSSMQHKHINKHVFMYTE